MLINGFPSKAAAIRHLRAAGHPINSLLAQPESNPKVAKNGKLDVLTAPLHLAPFNLSGFQVCPQASKGCAAACLHTAGNPAYMAQKDASRKAKTLAYFKEREAFMAVLTFEIMALRKKALKLGMVPAIRLNATSDLPFERRTITIQDPEYKRGPVTVSLMSYFHDVEFYDYTKVTKRAIAWAKGEMPANYHLTFSRAEDNDRAVAAVLEAGGNVTVVMSADKYKQAVTDGFLQGMGIVPAVAHKVTDGDAHDYRPADPVGCIVALKAKGDAKGDTSGFVYR